MPTHVQVSPDEDLAGDAAPTPSALPPPLALGGPAARTLIPDEEPVVAPPPPSPVPSGPPPLPPRASEAPTEPPPLPARYPPPPLAADGGTPDPAPRRAPAPPPAPVAPAPTVQSGGGPHPVLVALASFLFPGLGQLLVGQVAKGAVLFGLTVFTCGGFGLVNLFAAVDGFLVAARRQRGEPLGPWQFF